MPRVIIDTNALASRRSYRVNITEEHQRLAAIASDSWYGKGLNSATVAHSVRIFSRHWRPGSCLELGPAEGLATAALVTHFDDLTCVDGAETFCRQLSERHPGIHVTCSLLEQYKPGRTFDNIVLGHVLEHVEGPDFCRLRSIRTSRTIRAVASAGMNVKGPSCSPTSNT